MARRNDTGFRFWSVVIAALILLAGLGLIAWAVVIKTGHAFDQAFWADVLKEFGVALIIASAVTLGIESFARFTHNREVREHLALVGRNVFKAVYGGKVENVFFEHFEEHVIESDFVRESLEVNVYLQAGAGSAALPRDENAEIELHIDSRFTIRNVTAGGAEYPLLISVEKPWTATCR